MTQPEEQPAHWWERSNLWNAVAGMVVAGVALIAAYAEPQKATAIMAFGGTLAAFIGNLGSILSKKAGVQKATAQTRAVATETAQAVAEQVTPPLAAQVAASTVEQIAAEERRP